MFKSTTFTFLEKYAVLGFTAVLFLTSFNSVYADTISAQSLNDQQLVSSSINDFSTGIPLGDLGTSEYASGTLSLLFNTDHTPHGSDLYYCFNFTGYSDNTYATSTGGVGGICGTALSTDNSDLIWTSFGTTTFSSGTYYKMFPSGYSGSAKFGASSANDFYYTLYSGSTSTPTSSDYESYFECDTCTRIISHDPYTDEVLASTTSGYMVSADVYVNADDLGLGNDGYIQFWLSPPLSDEVHKSSPIPIESLDTTETYLYYYNSSYISATGTYTMSIHVVDEGFYWDNDIRNTYFSFALGTENTATETQAYYETSRANDFETENYIEGIIEEPGKLALLIDDVFADFIHLPPFGYVVIFIETMQNGTTTAFDNLEMGFATSSPLHGTTINLDLAGGFETAIQNIRDDGVNSEHGDSFDTFMYYWELMFYMGFAVWLIKELLGLSVLSGGSGGGVGRSSGQTFKGTSGNSTGDNIKFK